MLLFAVGFWLFWNGFVALKMLEWSAEPRAPLRAAAVQIAAIAVTLGNLLITGSALLSQLQEG